ncbi:unnamed protein product [Paramecium sonneborni]|uniref:Uncharacterized protein n=1 Tax=Paramecium sonneborni TaxID=65129 RepID=A0A8S1PRR2_9CILI|nr:unnamed protein product [Paramecium sonneborni]
MRLFFVSIIKVKVRTSKLGALFCLNLSQNYFSNLLEHIIIKIQIKCT